MKAVRNWPLLLLLSSGLLLSCKKSTSSEDPSPSESSGKYYFKGTVESTLVETKEGSGYDPVDAIGTSPDGGSGFYAGYTFSLQKFNVSDEKYFQLSLNFAHIPDGDDTDEMLTLFAVGFDTLNKSNDPVYKLTYDDGDIEYRLKDDNDTTKIYIDEVTDLGAESGGSARVVQVKGHIDAVRLHEYSFSSGFGTGSVLIEDLEFLVRFKSYTE